MNHFDHLSIALQNAANGWPQFPVDQEKRPFKGFFDWEHNATLSAEAITVFGTIDHPGCLWATVPGMVGKTCIDIDQHADKPDGFRSLAMLGLSVKTPHVYTSVSGNGRHAWYQGRSSSRNALYPGIDRKSVGGYVVTPYLLPPVSEVMTRLPEAFHGRDDDHEQHPFKGDAAGWLAEHAGFSPAQRVRSVVKEAAREEFRGHSSMVKRQTRLVHLAREGHGGVPEALSELREMWVSAEHGKNEDPAVEWQTALLGAIKKYGGGRNDSGRGVSGPVDGSGAGDSAGRRAARGGAAYSRHGVDGASPGRRGLVAAE